jgi:aldose 1-epimerase
MSYTINIAEEKGFSVIELKNAANTCTATITTFGSLLHSFNILQPDGNWHNAVYSNSHEEVQENLTKGFKSAKLAPFTCRMHLGRYTFHNTHFHIEKFYMLKHAIHGLVYDQMYEIKQTFADDTKAGVELETYYYGKDPGYPYQFKLNVTWTLSADNQLSVTTVMQHYNDIAIPFADGWHPYFKLEHNR